MLDGKGPYHLALDSGSPFALLDAGVAAALGLEVRERAPIGGVGDRDVGAGSARLRTLSLGGLVLRDHPAIVTALRATFGAAEGQAVDGVIGRDVLETTPTTIDYANATVTFGADVDALVRGGATVVPFVLHGGVPQIACAVAGVEARCNVDTGSRLALSVFAPFARAHPEVVPAAESAVGIDGFGLGGAAYGRLGRVATFAFGGFTFTGTIADFSVQTRGAFADKAGAANIGGALLRAFAVTFDYAHRRLVLAPNANFGEVPAFDRSGLFLGTCDRSLCVLDARASTPAARAGLARGDTLLAADGEAVTDRSLSHLRERLSGPAGGVVRLRVRRDDGTVREVALTLADYV